MKKNLSLTGALLLICLLASHAQKFEGQLLMGPSLTSLRGNEAVKTLNPTINFSGGLGINYHLKKSALLNAQLLFEKKGAATGYDQVIYSGPDPGTQDGKAKLSARYSYITLPVQYKYRLGTTVQYEFGLGMYGSYLVNQYSIVKTKDISDYSGGRDNNTTNDKRYDLGLSAGFSLLIPIHESIALSIGLNDNLGLTNTSKVQVANNGTVKNNSLTLLLGLNYKFGKG